MNQTFALMALLALAVPRNGTAAPLVPPPGSDDGSLVDPPSASHAATRPVQVPMSDHASFGTIEDEVESPKSEISSQNVQDAQRALTANGFTVKPDGIAGPQTTAALRSFQLEQGLEPTGNLDAGTLRQLNADTQSIPPASRASDQPSSF